MIWQFYCFNVKTFSISVRAVLKKIRFIVPYVQNYTLYSDCTGTSYYNDGGCLPLYNSKYSVTESICMRKANQEVLFAKFSIFT